MTSLLLTIAAVLVISTLFLCNRKEVSHVHVYHSMSTSREILSWDAVGQHKRDIFGRPDRVKMQYEQLFACLIEGPKVTPLALVASVLYLLFTVHATITALAGSSSQIHRYMYTCNSNLHVSPPHAWRLMKLECNISQKYGMNN